MLTMDCIEKSGCRWCRDPGEADLGRGLNITMIIFNFTEREMRVRVQTRRQAARPTSQTRDKTDVCKEIPWSRNPDPGPSTDAGDGNILVMADTERCVAHHHQAVLASKYWICVMKSTVSPKSIPCWAQKWLTFITFYNTPNIS